MSKPEHVSVVLDRVLGRLAEGKDPVTGKDPRPPLAVRPLEHPVICDVCNAPRNRGDHQACSRTRQERYRAMRETESIQQGDKA